MFATLRCNKEALCVERSTHPPFQGQGQQHSACNNCRAKKLKCTGEKNDCDRCRTKGIQCVYVEPAHSKGAKRRRSNQSSAGNTSTPSSSSVSASSAASAELLTDVSVVRADQAPATGAINGPHSAKEHTNAANTPTEHRVPVDDVGNFDLGITSDFISLLETSAPNIGGGGQEDEMTFISCSTAELNEDSRLSFSDLTTLEPVVEDYLDFDFEIESNQRLNGTGNVMDDTCSYLSDFNYDFSVLPSPIHMPSPIQSTLVDPSASPAQIHQLNQARLRQDSPPLPTADSDVPGSLALVYDHDDVTSRSSSTTSSYSSPSCPCMHTALGILENLEVKNSRLNLYAIDHVLCFKKRALAQCNAMLDCRNCNTLSGFMMLLVVICEKMVVSFERLATSCREQQEQHRTPLGVGGWRKSENTGLASGQSIFLGDYEVDLAEERWCLVRVLITLQMKNLGDLLVRLKRVASPWNWETHNTILGSIDRRFRDTAASIRRMDAGRELSM
ncbi:MAG: hypothetical protein M1830_007207 [Pleopsidium flavum]|nr:MAG: hypothetical protein M1830_007207 [Pleopsidium flavum]